MDESEVPCVGYIGSVPDRIIPSLASSYNIEVKSDKAGTPYKFGSSLPHVEEWLETLAGPQVNWLPALIRSENIVQQSGYIANSLKCLLVPHVGLSQSVQCGWCSMSVSLSGAVPSFGMHGPAFEAVTVAYDAKTSSTTVVVNEDS